MQSAQIKERFQQLLDKREAAKTQLVQLQTKKESATESMQEIEKEWKEKWEVNSFEEAQSKMKEMEQEISETITECEKFLEKVEL